MNDGILYVALDVETANPDLGSICQVGLCFFNSNGFCNSWGTLVNPEDEFDEWNVQIHGITEENTKGAPRFIDIFPKLDEFLHSSIVVIHTQFDRIAIERACEKYGIPIREYLWLDSAKVVRRTWAERSLRGYGLKDVASGLGINFKHHDAKDDARAAGEILFHAIKASGICLNDWLSKQYKRISLENPEKGNVERDGDPNGPYFGEKMVFTGTLSIPRKDAANIAAKMGFEVQNGVTKETTFLVVGNQDIRHLNGKEKSSKHRKAEELITNGKALRIIVESDFERLFLKEKSTLE